MKRLLFIFLLCLFPLQVSLAAVAEYCGHEPAEAQASHPGHHEHEHQKTPEKAPDPFPQADLDCAHHWSPVLVPSFVAASIVDSHWSYCLDHPSDFQSAVLGIGVAMLIHEGSTIAVVLNALRLVAFPDSPA